MSSSTAANTHPSPLTLDLLVEADDVLSHARDPHVPPRRSLRTELGLCCRDRGHGRGRRWPLGTSLPASGCEWWGAWACWLTMPESGAPGSERASASCWAIRPSTRRPQGSQKPTKAQVPDQPDVQPDRTGLRGEKTNINRRRRAPPSATSRHDFGQSQAAAPVVLAVVLPAVAGVTSAHSCRLAQAGPSAVCAWDVRNLHRPRIRAPRPRRAATSVCDSLAGRAGLPRAALRRTALPRRQGCHHGGATRTAAAVQHQRLAVQCT